MSTDLNAPRCGGVEMDSKELEECLGRAMNEDNLTKKGASLEELLAEAGINARGGYGYFEAIQMIGRVIRLRCIDERGIAPGLTMICQGRATPVVVNSLTKLGFVKLEGIRGSVSPQQLSHRE